MNDLPVLPIVVLGTGALMIWGGLTGQNPVQRVKTILTRGGVQSPPASDSATGVSTATATGSGSYTTNTTYTTRRDYLA